MANKILITGINGFIGTHLAKTLSKAGHQIIGLDITPLRSDLSGIVYDFIHQDITISFSIGLEFEELIHLAALNITHVGKASRDKYLKVNVEGTKNLIKACQTKRFIFMSTAKVYGQNAGVRTEAFHVDPIGDYEKSKLQAEKICLELVNPLQLVILRPVNIVGPGQLNKAIIPQFFSKALNNQSIHIFVPKELRMQLLSVYDFISFLQQLIREPDCWGIFNLASPEKISVLELAQRIVKMCKSTSTIQCTGPQKTNFQFVDSQKASRDLHWQTHQTIEKILWDYYQTEFKLNQIRSIK